MTTDETRTHDDEAPEGGAGEFVEVDESTLDDAVRALLMRLESERDDAVDARLRALADFANFQRRAAENERRAREEASAEIVRGLLPAIDHLDLALESAAAGDASDDALLGGVRMVRDEILGALARHGIEPLRPQPGDEFDPNRHAAMMRQATDEHEPGRIVMVMQAGWAKGERVLRPAAVAIAEAPGAEPA